MGNKEKVLVTGMVFLVGIFLISFVQAETLIFSEAGVEYDSEILEEFNKVNQTFVKIIIDLKNVSEVDDLISFFSEDKVRNIINRDISPGRISIDVTEEGFNELIQDERIKTIYFNAPVHAIGNGNKIDLENKTKDENNNNSTTIKPEVKEKNLKLIFWILIGMVVVLVIILKIFKFKKE